MNFAKDQLRSADYPGPAKQSVESRAVIPVILG